MKAQTAVFLDRDGTLNEDRGYVTSVKDFVLLPGVCEGIARLNRLRLPVIVVTNQSAIARGLMTEEDLSQIHQGFAHSLQCAGAHVDAFYFCPHHPQAGCECRKPQPGMIYQAVRDFGLNISRCCLIGDKHSDLETAQASGMEGVLVKTSPYASQALAAYRNNLLPIAYVADSFSQAIDWVVQKEFKTTFS
ncbi:MAG: D-glycero-alpha-D-manno-heptose-1,7-bisphosphate 7-phosphatase [Nitrospirales bacterium]